MRVAGRASDEGKTQLPKARVFKTHYGAKVRGRIIIKTFYDFPPSFPCRCFSHVKEGIYQAILFFWEQGKSYNFCMMSSKIYGNFYDFHSSLSGGLSHKLYAILQWAETSEKLCVAYSTIVHSVPKAVIISVFHNEKLCSGVTLTA
jgi:hypothetical protein